MNELVKPHIESATNLMQKAISHLEAELAKIRAGKASPAMMDGIFVDYYGNNTPLNQVANINTPDAITIVIQPWEKNMLQTIEKAIFSSNMGLTPQNDGQQIRLNLPPVTEERRLLPKILRQLFKTLLIHTARRLKSIWKLRRRK